MPKLRHPLPVRRLSPQSSLAVAVLLANGSVAGAQVPAPLRPDAGRLAAAPPALQERLREDPFVYFRLLNTDWAAAVCEAFRGELPALPTAILHGDAHLEQYAVTATAHGLDDFDDAAHGPSVIDLVRFLGSTELVARRRGWTADRERLFDRFFDGYSRSLADPSYQPPEPAVVARLRARARKTREQFLAWGESLMQEPTALQREGFVRSLRLVETLVRELQPDVPAGYFGLRRVGWLRMGVGSILVPKALARIEGPSPAPGDDVLLEAKQLSQLEGVPCVQVPLSGEAFRVIRAAEQIGRIRHDVLLVAPRREDQGPGVRDWWVRTWDETYVEMETADLGSPDELEEVVHDVGAQLGSTSLRESIPLLEAQLRHAELAAVRRLEPRIRATARRLVDGLLVDWERWRASP
jgi:Uncharacterized protein conserved in bacteria (DUF2252)